MQGSAVKQYIFVQVPMKVNINKPISAFVQNWLSTLCVFTIAGVQCSAVHYKGSQVLESLHLGVLQSDVTKYAVPFDPMEVS